MACQLCYLSLFEFHSHDKTKNFRQLFWDGLSDHQDPRTRRNLSSLSNYTIKAQNCRLPICVCVCVCVCVWVCVCCLAHLRYNSAVFQFTLLESVENPFNRVTINHLKEICLFLLATIKIFSFCFSELFMFLDVSAIYLFIEIHCIWYCFFTLKSGLIWLDSISGLLSPVAVSCSCQLMAQLSKKTKQISKHSGILANIQCQYLWIQKTVHFFHFNCDKWLALLHLLGVYKV